MFPLNAILVGCKAEVLAQMRRELAAQEQRVRLQEFVQSDRARGFEFDQPPLMRVTLIRLGETEHQVVWSQHHALLDGWSIPVLLGELFSCYAALSRQQEPKLPPARPYRDYIAWLMRQDRVAS